MTPTVSNALTLVGNTVKVSELLNHLLRLQQRGAILPGDILRVEIAPENECPVRLWASSEKLVGWSAFGFCFCETQQSTAESPASEGDELNDCQPPEPGEEDDEKHGVKTITEHAADAGLNDPQAVDQLLRHLSAQHPYVESVTRVSRDLFQEFLRTVRVAVQGAGGSKVLGISA